MELRRTLVQNNFAPGQDDPTQTPVIITGPLAGPHRSPAPDVKVSGGVRRRCGRLSGCGSGHRGLMSRRRGSRRPDSALGTGWPDAGQTPPAALLVSASAPRSPSPSSTPSASTAPSAPSSTRTLQAASGVGRKSALRIVNELQGKIPDHLTAAAPPPNAAEDARRLAREALAELGFRDTEIEGALDDALRRDPAANAPALIRTVLPARGRRQSGDGA